MTPLLQDKNVIVYGAGGGLGGGVARTFAREGANLFLVGRTRAPLEAVAADIADKGGSAEIAVLDVFDEQAVEEHARSVGVIDVSFNLISRGDVHGQPLLQMSTEDFARPVTAGLTANFITARAAARHMVERGSGVILTVTSGSAQAQGPMMGGTGSADAAVESFLRALAAEVGPSGVRVVGLWTAGVPETFGMEHDSNASRRASGMKAEDIDRVISGMSMLRKAPRLAQFADTAAFLASDHAAAITATTVNVTCGLVTG